MTTTHTTPLARPTIHNLAKISPATATDRRGHRRTYVTCCGMRRQTLTLRDGRRWFHCHRCFRTYVGEQTKETGQ